jgi:uncharacterized membrane protein YqjE
MSKAPAPAPKPAARQDEPARHRLLFIGIVIDFVLCGLALLMGALVQANSPTGQGAGIATLVAVVVLGGAPALAWSLYNTSRVDIRWLILLAWIPIVLLAIGIPISIAYA